MLVHVADAAGNESSAELPVEIRRWLLAPDPESPGKSVLVIGGTPGNDHIQVLAQKKKGQRLRPRVGGESLGQFQSAALSRLVVFAGEGNDRIKIARSLALPAEVHAGEGNNRVDGGRGATWITAGGGNDHLRTGAGHDRIEAGGGNDLVLDGPGNDFIDGGPGSDQLAGGAGDDLLLGGPGSDLLLGGPGDDLLIGGLDADLLSGNRGDDLVIAGSTHYDDNEEALALLAAEWHAARMAAARIANLSTGTGPVLAGTGIRLIHGTTVADDQAHDLVFNSQGEDWIIVDWRTRCCRRSKSRRTAAFSNLAEWEGT